MKEDREAKINKLMLVQKEFSKAKKEVITSLVTDLEEIFSLMEKLNITIYTDEAFYDYSEGNEDIRPQINILDSGGIEIVSE